MASRAHGGATRRAECTVRATGSRWIADVAATLGLGYVRTRITAAWRPMLALLVSGMVAAPTASAEGCTWLANRQGRSISAIDTMKAEVAMRLAVDVPYGPVAVAVTADGRRAYATHPESGVISEIDVERRKTVQTIDVAGRPYGIAIDERERTLLFVTDIERDALLVVDPKKRIVIDILSVAATPTGVALDHAHRRIYVASTGSNFLTVLDADLPRKYAEWTTGRGPSSIALSHADGRVYVGNVYSHDITVIDTKVDAVVDTISLGKRPDGIEVGPDDATVIVALPGDEALAIVDVRQPRAAIRIPIGFRPEGLALSGDGRRAVAVDGLGRNVAVVDLTLRPARRVEAAALARRGCAIEASAP